MQTKKKYLVILPVIIALGTCLWFFASKTLAPKTLVITASKNQNDGPQNSASSETSPASDNPAQNIPRNNTGSEQKTATPEQDVPDRNLSSSSADISQVEDPTQNEQPPSTPSFIKKKLISWGFQKSQGRKIDTIIIHSSYDALGDDPYDVDGVLDEFKQYGVSAHYLINRKGTAYQLVENDNIAYHAGVSSVPDGRTNVNSFSIGIELMNTKEDEYTKTQYQSLNKLLVFLKNTYSIKYVLGHKDIAPGRKDDPWNLDWDKVD